MRWQGDKAAQGRLPNFVRNSVPTASKDAVSTFLSSKLQMTDRLQQLQPLLRYLQQRGREAALLLQRHRPSDEDESLLRMALGVIVLLSCISWVYGKLVLTLKAHRLARTVPGVKGGLPILGQALNLISTPPWDLLTSWVSVYGPLYRFSLFGTQVVVVADPHYMKEIMHTKVSEAQTFVCGHKRS